MNNRIKYSLAQEITNRVILTQTANRQKSNRLPKEYLANVRDQFPQALELQSIPLDEKLWEIDNFELFLEARRKLLAQQLNEFLNSLSDTQFLPFTVTTEDLLAEGESNVLEFKSSMLWDYDLEKIDKRLELVVMKTISAFSNAEGGTLIIGVDDEGNVLGLERDYNYLKGNKDEFELHLRNLANIHLGKVFSTTNLVVTFETIEDKEICKIEILPGRSPIYMEDFDKNNQKQKKFFVRSGNTSQPLGVHEVSDYIHSRFTNSKNS
jgi:hypothetical protein